ncbi:MAG: hypothetical protein ACOC33_02465 [bacterium]
MDNSNIEYISHRIDDIHLGDNYFAILATPLSTPYGSILKDLLENNIEVTPSMKFCATIENNEYKEISIKSFNLTIRIDNENY